MARAVPDRRPAGRLRRRIPYVAYRFASLLANGLPRPVAATVFSGLSAGSAVLLRRRRAVVGRHLQRVHGRPLVGVARAWAVHRAFQSYGRYWLESFRLPHTAPEELEAGMSWEGIAHLEDALEAGHGAILALPHLGGWDFGGAWLASIGYRLLVVVEDLEPPELLAWLTDLRHTIGLTVVPQGPQVGAAVLKALKANGIVALLCDRDLTGGGVQVEFFGERTTLPAGPATLALRTGAVLLPTAVYFEGSGHLGIVRPPIPTHRSGDGLRADVARVTQALAYEFESLIRRAPEQWHLLQPNWPSDYELLKG